MNQDPRDFFAATALHAMFTSQAYGISMADGIGRQGEKTITLERFCLQAFAVADAMMDARAITWRKENDFPEI